MAHSIHRQTHERMTRALLTHHIDTAFEDSVGKAGANLASFHRLRSQLSPAIGRIHQHPVAQAAPLFALPSRTDDLAEIESVATHIAEHFSALVVLGMGGSSLSGKALAHLRKSGGLALHCVDTIDPHSLAVLIEELPWRTTAFLVVSKSGGTVETNAQMAVFLNEAKKRGLPIAKHFFVITVPNDNPLHRFAVANGFRVVAHDAELGGRFAILSAVGLIPAAAVGVDIRGLRAGAAITIAENFMMPSSPAADAAALHVALMEKNININVLTHYCDRLGGVVSWYRQCWAESLGKNGKGSVPVPTRGVNYQHSQLQLYLEGPRDKFFTALVVDSTGQGAPIEIAGTDDARLAYLKGQTVGDLSMAEQRASNATLIKAGCPLRSIHCAALDESVFGALIMHLALEVIFTAELLGVNAFDQPAVEWSKHLALEFLSGK